MAILQILTAPNDKLRMQAQSVEDFPAIQSLIDDMLETLYDTEDGIGLAATQVGRTESIIIIDISENRNEPLILVNPTIVSAQDKAKGQEGCLSVPGYYADIERFSKIQVSAQDRNGNDLNFENDDFLAVVIQHEIDHLMGKLFIDYLSPLKRQVALKKVKNSLKSLA